ncbi:MAG TPA: KamA family radical SAM protein [Tenuifilaceae bacterium]|nr:KamA family radical SAM protein [Tenuifilaceae bacterium]HPJ44676.1 KamA family radical SAM protein [Tenuifilaceae bacterium]HPQ32940.1 KamA family radical SAM protein [Tenuifilaceae bacterium]HRX66758.1 KamA family radical SAM protein [Tenuifilaceae bacterium]
MENTQHEKLVYLINEYTEDDEPPSIVTISSDDSEVAFSLNKVGARTGNERIEISEHSREFLSKHFPSATEKDWNSWQWQIKNGITTHQRLASILNLSEEEAEAIADPKNSLPLRITPYYASLLAANKPEHALRRTMVPTVNELKISKGEESDPLSEEDCSPVPNIVHRYPDRVLFLSTGFCSAYCRYCTRSHMVAKDKCHVGIKAWQPALDYISNHPEIRDVLISGGDPLTMPDSHIEYLLSSIRKIPHVEIIRIGTKVPVVLPQRITRSLVSMLKKYQPLFMSIHFTHADEITPETAQACKRLADAGIPLGSQTVLLKGVNDEVATMKSLVHGLLKIRVRPYYLYQCDPIPGSAHFRTPVAKGLEIIRGLRGHTSGYAIPTYVIDAPGGGGKIPLLPDYYQGTENGEVILKNYKNKLFKYPDYNVD